MSNQKSKSSKFLNEKIANISKEKILDLNKFENLGFAENLENNQKIVFIPAILSSVSKIKSENHFFDKQKQKFTNKSLNNVYMYMGNSDGTVDASRTIHFNKLYHSVQPLEFFDDDNKKKICQSKSFFSDIENNSNNRPNLQNQNFNYDIQNLSDDNENYI